MAIIELMKSFKKSILKWFSDPDDKDSGFNPDEQLLYDKAVSTAKQFIQASKPISAFAMAIDKNGEITSYLASEDYSDLQQAFGGLLGVLIPLAKIGDIRASVIVSPVPEGALGKKSGVIFDLEAQNRRRNMMVLQYKADGENTIYDQMDVTQASPKIFVS